MTLREKIQTMEAFERGEYVEVRTDKTVAGQWGVAIDPLWDWNNNDYRIKPKPKQTVTIERWLVEDRFGIRSVVELHYHDMACYFHEYQMTGIKLLSKYEVGL